MKFSVKDKGLLEDVFCDFLFEDTYDIKDKYEYEKLQYLGFKLKCKMLLMFDEGKCSEKEFKLLVDRISALNEVLLNYELQNCF